MPRCEVCGNDYDLAFEVAGSSGTGFGSSRRSGIRTLNGGHRQRLDSADRGGCPPAVFRRLITAAKAHSDSLSPRTGSEHARTADSSAGYVLSIASPGQQDVPPFSTVGVL
jgi:hypothetical protein